MFVFQDKRYDATDKHKPLLIFVMKSGIIHYVIFDQNLLKF